MPYIYQNEDGMKEAELRENANMADPGMENYIYQCMKTKKGKWVRYDNNGKMIKGWVTIGKNNDLDKAYPTQVGNTYYYDKMTGTMAKGWLTIGGKNYHFDEQSGVLLN